MAADVVDGERRGGLGFEPGGVLLANVESLQAYAGPNLRTGVLKDARPRSVRTILSRTVEVAPR